jgi:hypothetical protein
VADPEMLESFKEAKAEQEHQRQRHMAMLAKKKKERDLLIHQLTVGATVLVIGGALAVGAVMLIIKILT